MNKAWSLGDIDKACDSAIRKAREAAFGKGVRAPARPADRAQSAEVPMRRARSAHGRNKARPSAAPGNCFTTRPTVFFLTLMMRTWAETSTTITSSPTRTSSPTNPLLVLLQKRRSQSGILPWPLDRLLRRLLFVFQFMLVLQFLALLMGRILERLLDLIFQFLGLLLDRLLESLLLTAFHRLLRHQHQCQRSS